MTGTSFGWPDVIIIAVLALAAIKGFARGFISELGGIVAVLLALAAAFYYNGMLDNGLERAFKMNPGSAHVTGLILSGLIVYGVVMLVIWLLGRYVHLPVLGAGNALGGGVVGLAKGAVLLWVVLFVALLFPLSQSLRADLHKSRLVAVLSQQNRRVDDAIYSKLPDLAKPFVQPILQRQQV
ncbi:MAG TPA: CvpA family protein [Candidatus Tyrphobacter sp.]